VVEREFSLRELEFFPQAGVGFDVRKLKVTLSDVFFYRRIQRVSEQVHTPVRHRERPRAAPLAQNAVCQDLGDLNKFLRDFMLDPPETFTVAETLVNEFQVLNSAHEAVLTARRQIEALRPAREALAEYDQTRAMLSSLAEERLASIVSRSNGANGCWTRRSRSCTPGPAGIVQKHRVPQDREGQEESAYDSLLAKRAAGMAAPASPQSFAEVQTKARQVVNQRESMTRRHESELDKYKETKRSTEERFTALVAEIRAMETRKSKHALQSAGNPRADVSLATHLGGEPALCR